MSTDSNSPSGAPQDSETPVAASGDEVTQAGAVQEGQPDDQAKPRIKIGTQRPGVAPPRLPPRTQIAFHTGAAPPQVEQHPAQAKHDTGQETSKPPQPPREQKPRPKPPRVDTFVRQEKVDLPNMRAGLSPELEAELQEALGDRPIEDLIASDAGGAATAEAIEPESRHQVRVVRIFRDNVFVELPGHNQGVLSLHQFAEEPQVGAILDVSVNRFNAEEGLYELTAAGASVDVGDWSDIAEGIVVDAQITSHNKGGLECQVSNIRGFIPAGQISLYRVENFEEFVGQRWPCVVTEANRDRRNLVLSRRAVLEREQAEAKEKLLATLEVGQVREGVVRSVRDFGAFVDLGGIDGLIHVSQMSWERVKSATDVMQVGQRVKVKINKIDPDTHKISLAYRDLFESPWTNAASKYPVTSKVRGTVSKIMDFGAFVKLEPGVEGLVHISELSHKRVFRCTEVVQEGQEIEAKVLSVDPENQRISLSMKALEARPEPAGGRSKAEDDGGESESSAAASTKAPPKKRKVPLKGGLGRSPKADEFGLRW